MKNTIVLIVLVAIVAFGGIFFANRNDSKPELTKKVGATIFPIYDITKQIAGDQFEVTLLLPPGASPHTFEPQPSLIKDLEGAQLIFAIGYGLDDWASQISDAAIVTIDQGIELHITNEEQESHEVEHEHKEDGHDHGPTDPHYWLSIKNAKIIAANIANELTKLDSANASLYMQRTEAYANELDAVATELKNQTANLATKNIISLHDAWYYFANDLGINIVGTFEPSAGTEPTPQYLADLQEEIKKQNASVLFLEPQLSTNSIKAFAEDQNLSLAVIDPLGGTGDTMNYIELMRYNVKQISQALNL